MLTVKKRTSPVKSATIASGGPVSTGNIILSESECYEEVVVSVTAAEAADMAAASTLKLLVGDQEVMKEDGSAILLVTKPAAGVGIYQRFPAPGARIVSVELSATPTNPVTVKVQGIGAMDIAGIVKKATI